jgi:DNA polymerase-3 subunit beta
MKCIVVRANLKEGLHATERATGEGGNLAILHNVLLEAGENRIFLTVTNLELGIRFALSAKVIEKGKVTVPAALMSTLVANLPQERLNLEKKGVDLVVKTDNYEAILKGLSPDEFPIIPKLKSEEESLTVKGAVLKDAINRAVIAAQPSGVKPELGSVLFDFGLDFLKVVATDNFRLAEKTIHASSYETNIKDAFKMLVPLRTCQEIVRIVRDDEDVRILRDTHQVLVRTEACEITSRLIDATFPDYEPIVPKKLSTEVIVDREELISAVRLAGVFGSKTSEARLAVSRGKKTLELSSGEQATGENSYVLSAKVQGEDAEASFNWHHLLDGLKLLRDDTVFFGLSGEHKPAILKSPKETSYFYILAPLYPKGA